MTQLTVKFEQHLYDDFILRLNKSTNKRALKFVSSFDVTMTGILCGVCHESLPVYCYRQDKCHKHGINTKNCTKCFHQARDPWKRRWQNTVQRTKQRNKKGRCHGDVEYSPDELRDMYHAQGRRCYISGNIMVEEYGTGNPYSASVERLDNTKGYIKGNVVIICQYLQISKGDYLPDEIKCWLEYASTTDDFVLDNTIFNKPPASRRKYRKSVVVGDTRSCTDCEKILSLSSFSCKSSICKPCNAIRSTNYRNTPYGFVVKMATDAKQSAKKRGSKRKRNDSSHDVEDDLFTLFVDIIKHQGGRCAITGIPFVYQQNHKFAPSVDRLDDSKGYMSGNVRMIIAPLNTRNNKIN